MKKTIICHDSDFKLVIMGSQKILARIGMGNALTAAEEIKIQRERVINLSRTHKSLANELEQAEARLQSLESRCPHNWTEPEFIGYTERGYRIPSDKEAGLEMGVDSRPAIDVPPQDIKKWKRTCKTCGKTEETVRSEKVCGEVPRF